MATNPPPGQSNNRSVLRRMISSATGMADPEANYPSTSDTRTNNGTTSRPLTVITNQPGALVPPEDKLLIFRTLTGIDTVPVVSSAGHTIRSGANIGIYTRVIQHETNAKKLYTVVRVLASICLGLQIIMSAAVTALGAAGGSYNGITGLGACSTVTASIVAYIKGSGQPQKLRYGMSRWKWIREYIEQRERELCLAECDLDVYREIRIVEEMYQMVKDELASDKNIGQGQQGASTGGPGAPMARMSGEGMGLGRMGSMSSGRGLNERMGGFEERMGGFGDKLSGLGEKMGGFNERMGGFNDRMGSLREDTQHKSAGYGEKLHDLRDSATGLGAKVSGLASTLRERADEAGHTASDLRERADEVGTASHDVLQRATARPDSTATFTCSRCDRPTGEADKPGKE